MFKLIITILLVVNIWLLILSLLEKGFKALKKVVIKSIANYIMNQEVDTDELKH